MRIVYLNPCGQMGGAETSLEVLLGSVRAAEPEWELWLVLGEDGPLAGKARQLGVNVLIAPFPRELACLGDAGESSLNTFWSLAKGAAATVLYVRRMAAILRTAKPDVIHTNGFKMHLLGIWTRPLGIPVVWHIHDYVRRRPLMCRLLRWFSRYSSAAIVNSNSVGADLNSVVPNLRTVPIYNAVDLHRFASTGTRTDLDAVCGLPPATQGTLRVGLVATFARWKGHKVFLQALARLSRAVPVRGYIIGGPIYQTNGSQWSALELQQEAGRLGLDGRLGFTGFLDDTAAAMRSLDIVVHASTEPEPFGMVIVEAMACERAVIASQEGGAAELFVDGENALGHPPGDSEALAERILRLTGDKELRSRLGKAGRATALRLYESTRLARELLAVYRQVSSREAVIGSVQREPEPALPSSHPGVAGRQASL